MEGLILFGHEEEAGAQGVGGRMGDASSEVVINVVFHGLSLQMRQIIQLARW